MKSTPKLHEIEFSATSLNLHVSISINIFACFFSWRNTSLCRKHNLRVYIHRSRFCAQDHVMHSCQPYFISCIVMPYYFSICMNSELSAVFLEVHWVHFFHGKMMSAFFTKTKNSGAAYPRRMCVFLNDNMVKDKTNHKQ